MRKRRDLCGQVFGYLTVLGEAENKNGRTAWECSCSCGNFCSISTENLVAGWTKSCGCLSRALKSERSFVHGMVGRSVYNVWCTLKSRCNNSNNEKYPIYGGRGISYDIKWESFQGFWEDMQEGYEEGLSIDRIDVNGNYCKENCRWANLSEQAYNKRKHRNNTSGKTGVSFCKRTKKWRAYVRYDGKLKSLGHYDNLEDAIAARLAAELKYYGYNKE